VVAGVGLLLIPASTQAGPVARRQAGANKAAIEATVDQFRADLGGALNPNVPGSQPTGRREINWDGVPDGVSAPQNFPGTFFNVNSPRGAVFTTPGTGFQVSMDNDTPPDADPDQLNFGHFSAAYATAFVTFSPQRLFAPIGSTVMDVTFRVPGSNRPATVKGFGVVFTDVDVFGATTVEFFDELGKRLPVASDDTHPFISPNGVSFLGVSFDGGERVARVRITMGEVDLATGGADGVAGDAVAMDDFIYGEPQAITVPSHLDSSFGTGGWTTSDFGHTDQADAVIVDPDGKIVLAGTWDGGLADFAVLRLNADGTPDTTFSTDGRASLAFGPGTDRAYGIARQPDGKYVVVGVTDAGGGTPNNFAVARLNTDGTPDTTFSGDGMLAVDFGFEDQAHAVALQADGRIVVVGQAASDVAVLRLLPDGTLDTTFNDLPAPTPENGDGIHRFTLAGTDVARAVAIAEDGAILIAGATDGPGGRDFAIVRLLPSGALDPSFDGDGWATVDFTWAETGEALLLMPDGRILVGGPADGGTADFAVARLLPNGSLDTGFNPGAAGPTNFNGKHRIDLGGVDVLMAMALQADGKIVLAGYTNSGGGMVQNLAVARIASEGTTDLSFSTTGSQRYDFEADEAAYGAAVQSDGRIVLAGRRGADFLAVRLLGGPSPGVLITTPTTDLTSTATSPFTTLKGTAGDDVAVTSVTWATDRGFAGSATGTTAWSADVPLGAGANVITVTAHDANGNTASDTITITVSEFTYYLSEGATGAFFDLDILIANPTDTAANVAISYLKPDGTTVPQDFTLAARSRRTVKVEQVPGLEDTAVSAVIRSTNAVPLAVERTMFWDSTYYGGHTGNAVDAPATRWLFGEGNQGFFDTYVLLANANAQTAQATVTFLVEGGPNVVRVYDVAPTSRWNVYAGTIPELENKSFSIVVTSTLPIIAERAMYFGTRLFEGGHESAGVSQAATSWFHAEGATGDYFDTYILVGNPNPTPANLTVTFLKGDGTSLARSKQVPANGRFTLFVDGEDPALADTAVSTTVISDIPVVSERAMYWAGTSVTWFEAHNSFGVTSTGRKWALAEGRVGGAPEFETYVLIANPSASVAQVRATFLRANGGTIAKTYDVLPTSRFNIWVNAMVPELQHEDFGVLIEVINDVNVAVERALYWKSGGVGFAGGTNATAVRVP
jgi:uncharacterized delta-60 repeat protein